MRKRLWRRRLTADRADLAFTGAGSASFLPSCRQIEAAAHPPAMLATPRTASRAKLPAAARSLKSWSTLTLPRTRALRPPWRRRMQWACLRSCLGLGPGGVVVGLPSGISLGLAGLLQKGFVDADADDPAVLGGGAARPQRAARARLAEARIASPRS